MRSCLPAATGFGFVEKEEGRGKLAVFKLLPALLVWFFFCSFGPLGDGKGSKERSGSFP